MKVPESMVKLSLVSALKPSMHKPCLSSRGFLTKDSLAPFVASSWTLYENTWRSTLQKKGKVNASKGHKYYAELQIDTKNILEGSKLESLKVDGYLIHSQEMREILGKCDTLKEVWLRDCYVTGEDPLDEENYTYYDAKTKGDGFLWKG